MSRYIIGIDLGTTNCCLSYIDTESERLSIHLFSIPQLVNEGVVDAQPTLPSFCYLADSHEWLPNALNVPWRQNSHFFVGRFALSHGSKVPTRLVQSAKSWLCHPAVNRRDKILPLEAAEEGVRISPIEATARYLSHLKDGWNEMMAKSDPNAEFEGQTIILTVPASFDEVARTLTVEAAQQAGYQKLTLLEEPQAAFYSWIAQHEKSWEQKFQPGNSILVCDVGGGTTDFSLILVSSKEGKLTFERRAVGEHLLLGGDNMDIALAHFLEAKLKYPLKTSQWLQLKHEARKAKEALLSESGPENYRIVLQGEGSSVIAGSLTLEVHRNEIQQFLKEGFFGLYPWNEAIALAKKTGLKTMGLPYEEEPSITKHLAFFLKEHTSSEGITKPDYLLFNGGAMKPKMFQEAIVQSLKHWFPEKTPQILPSYHLDLAVSHGAAYYGKVQRGLGVLIGGGTARGYYLLCDVKDAEGAISKKALTLLPRGFFENTVFESEMTFQLAANAPVSFQLYSSHVRLNDRQGNLVAIDPAEMQMLPPMHTILRFGKKQLNQSQIPVNLSLEVSAIGTLEISLISQISDHRWKLDFQLKTASGQENSLAVLEKGRVDQTYQEGHLKDCQDILIQFFNGESAFKPEKLMEKLEETCGIPKAEWPPSLLRSLAETLLRQANGLKFSAQHQLRWWNLAGFLLRPGIGYPMDDFRLKELWKVILSEYQINKPDELMIQKWICYRRIAGGLNKGQQTQLAKTLLPLSMGKKLDGKPYHYAEQMRTLASMELLENGTKIKLGQVLVSRIVKGEAVSADFWALGRIGARQLFYGSLVNVISSQECARWIEELLLAPRSCDELLVFVMEQLARKTAHRELNLPIDTIHQILKRFEQHPSHERLESILLNENTLTQREQEQVFGDSLPSGLLFEEIHVTT